MGSSSAPHLNGMRGLLRLVSAWQAKRAQERVRSHTGIFDTRLAHVDWRPLEMTAYAKGRRAEWAVRDLMQAEGAIVVRSAGSKSPADLVALFPHKTYCIQVKTYKPSIKGDLQIAKEASRDTLAHWVVVWYELGRVRGSWAFKGGLEYKILPPGLQHAG